MMLYWPLMLLIMWDSTCGYMTYTRKVQNLS